MKSYEKLDSVRGRLFSFNYIPIFDVYFSDYLGNDLFVQVARCKKRNSMRIAFIDFNGSNKIVKMYYTDYGSKNMIDIMKGRHSLRSYIDGRVKKNNVYLNSYINGEYYEFSKYIPEDWDFLEDFFFLVFQFLPKCYEEIFKKMIIDSNHRLNYDSFYDGLRFNLFCDDIDTLFDKDVVKKGNKLYKNKDVLFLEKFDDRYYAVFSDFVVVRIKYDKRGHKLYFGCSCDDNFCSHVYAVLKFIVNRVIFPKFYKIVDVSNSHNILDILEVGEYYLSLGISDGKYIIMDNKGDIYRVPIMVDGVMQFAILEDEDHSLEDDLNSYLIDYYNDKKD